MKIPENVKVVLRKLEDSAFEAYLVGGCVRDALRGERPSDFDVTTSAFPDEIKAVFCDFPVFLQGQAHGTVGVIVNSEKIEITTFRTDGEYLDHRHPQNVVFSRNIEDDLSRRDFTVNAMAFSEKRGLVDLFGGRADIDGKIIRCVGESEKRFDEDALRILRALRFSSTLGYKIAPDTKSAVFKMKNLLANISGERIRDEIEKLVNGNMAGEVVSEYADVFKFLFPQIEVSLFVDNYSRLEKGKDRCALFFCAVENEKHIDQLKYSTALSSFYKNVARLFKKESFSSIYDVKKAVSQFGLDSVITSLKIKSLFNEKDHENLLALEKAVLENECMSKKDMAVKGADLMEIGFCKGKGIGDVLDTLFNLVLRGEVENTKKALLDKALTLK